MTVNDFYKYSGLITDETTVFICKEEKPELSIVGHWYEDHILEHMKDEVSRFSWSSEKVVFFYIKEAAG